MPHTTSIKMYVTSLIFCFIKWNYKVRIITDLRTDLDKDQVF